MHINRKSLMWLQLGGALILGVAAYLISRQMLDLEKQNLLNRLNHKDHGGSIIVATRALVTGDILSPENLATVDVSLEFMPEDVLSAEQFGEIAGLEIRQALAPGKPLLRSYVRAPIAERFSQLVGPGQRAVTIEVDNHMSIEGMIRVGDRLDLLIRTGSGTAAQLDVLAESVAVIATGSLRSASRDNPTEAVDESGNAGAYASLTVVLETEVAARALLARENGELIAMLRGPEDSEPMPFTRFDGHSGLSVRTVQFFSNARQEEGQLQPIDLSPVRNHPDSLFRQLARGTGTSPATPTNPQEATP